MLISKGMLQQGKMEPDLVRKMRDGIWPKDIALRGEIFAALSHAYIDDQPPPAWALAAIRRPPRAKAKLTSRPLLCLFCA